MVPIGAIAHLGQVVAPPLITLYNLFRVGHDHWRIGARL